MDDITKRMRRRELKQASNQKGNNMLLIHKDCKK